MSRPTVASRRIPPTKGRVCPPCLECPTCRVGLAKSPRQRTRCPACGAAIFVRARRDVFPGPLLNAEQARAADKFQRIGRQLGETGALLEELRASADSPGAMDDAIIAFLRGAAAFCREPAPHIWQRLARYEHAARRDFRPSLLEARRAELERIWRVAEPRWERVFVRIISCPSPRGACPACQGLAGTTLQLESALEAPPLPVAACSCRGPSGFGFCCCWYDWVTEPHRPSRGPRSTVTSNRAS